MSSDFLRNVPLFADLPEADLDRLCEEAREVVLEPGATLAVAEGDKIEVIDSAGRPIEIAAEGDDVVVTVLGATGQVVLIDGVRHGGAPDQTFTFENLALYVEDEGIDSSIAYVDPDMSTLGARTD